MLNIFCNKNIKQNIIKKNKNSINYNYILLFTERNNIKIYRKVLHEKFKHCLIISQTYNGWRFINPLQEGVMHKRIANCTLHNLLDVYSSMGYTTIYGKMLNPHKKIKKPIKYTCVSVCKKIIGINSFSIITPYQLYNYLLKNEIGSLFNKKL